MILVIEIAAGVLLGLLTEDSIGTGEEGYKRKAGAKYNHEQTCRKRIRQTGRSITASTVSLSSISSGSVANSVNYHAFLNKMRRRENSWQRRRVTYSVSANTSPTLLTRLENRLHL
jgi:hypothetical protein